MTDPWLDTELEYAWAEEIKDLARLEPTSEMAMVPTWRMNGTE